MARKKRNPFDEVDGMNQHIPFARLTDEMARSKVYQGMSADAKNVLSICKLCRQFHISPDNWIRDNPLYFYFNRELQKRYGLNNPNKTRKALAELVQNGFVDVQENNAYQHIKNVYSFSNKWKKYEKTGEIELSPAAKTFLQGHKKL